MKLITLLALAGIHAMASHKNLRYVNKEIVEAIKLSKTTWTPFDNDSNPLLDRDISKMIGSTDEEESFASIF